MKQTILIKRPKIGQKVRSQKHGFEGMVIGIISFEEAFAWEKDSERNKIMRDLRAELGETFEERYFEAVIKPTITHLDSKFADEKIITLSWKEYQKLEVLTD